MIRKTFLKKIICIVLVLFGFKSNSQTTIYSETFGFCVSTFPVSWTNSSADWIVDQGVSCGGGVSSCTVAASSGNSMMAGADGGSSLEETVSEPFSTIGYSGMLLSWNGLRSTGAPLLSVSMSTNNTTWTSITFTDVITDDAWHAITPISVPASFDNQANVYIKWSYTGTGLGAYIALDDIKVVNTCTAPTLPGMFVSSSTVCPGSSATITTVGGNLNSATNWVWSQGSCTSTAIGTGTSIVVTPTAPLTYYYVRGLGGCVTTGACQSRSIAVRPPTTSNAGPNQNLCISSPNAIMAANTPVIGVGSWSLVSGSGAITNSLSNTSSVTGLGLGNNIFAWTITNSTCTPSSSNVTITINPLVTISNAGPSQTVCPSSSSITTAANTPTVGSGAWSLVSGSGIITNSLSPVTTITGLGAGINVFAWTISGLPCMPSVSNLTVTVVPASLNAGSNFNLVCKQTQLINATTNPPSPASVVWSPTTGLSNSTTLTPIAKGTGSNIIYTVTCVLSNGCVPPASTVSVGTTTITAPDICMVATDSLGVNNEIFWDKSLYPNADSFFVYRETSTSVFTRIGRIPRTSVSMYADTNRSIGPFNGNPNLTAYKYKLQYKDSCGSLSPLSLWHQTIFVQDQLNGNFNWTQYTIESTTLTPVSSYNLKRRDLATGTETLIVATGTNVATDPSWATFWPTNVKWFVDATGFSCNVTAKTIPGNETMVLKAKTKSNQSNDKLFATGIASFNLDDKIKVYPNPANDVLNIDLSNLPKSEITTEIHNTIGQLVYETKTFNHNLVINTSSFAGGVYTVNIKQGGKTIAVKKVVIER